MEEKFQVRLPVGYQIKNRVVDTKHVCYVLESKGNLLFMKIYKNHDSGLIEFNMLNSISQISKQNDLCFRVTRVLDFIEDSGYSALITEYIQGYTIRDILFSNSLKPQIINWEQVVKAIAQLHNIMKLVIESNHILYGTQKHSTVSSPQISKEFDDFNHLLITEGIAKIPIQQIIQIQELILPYFEFLDLVTLDFPLDYYKDANPANWIINDKELFAIDFEGLRVKPFLVDLINITEYAFNYLCGEDKEMLLLKYIKERNQYSDIWANRIANFDLKFINSLLCIFRHQEQILHRIRDMSSTETNNWHKNAFFYHCNRIIEELDFLQTRTDQKIPFINNFRDVCRIYRENVI